MASLDDRLHVCRLPDRPRGLVLMLHGGAERGQKETDERSLAYRRTRWMLASVKRPLGERGVAVGLLRFTLKGWNAGLADVPSPVADARGAVARLREEYVGLPIVLLGHSMGARTAVWAADQPGVAGVVGLAPWLPPDDPVETLADRHLVAAHGSRDRITSARATATYVRRAADVAASASYVDMGPLGHYMLNGVRRWNATAISGCLGVLAHGTDTVAGVTSPG